MLELEFTTEDIERLFQERFSHPHPLVQKKMEALYLTSQGLSQAAICRLGRLSRATLGRYRQEYRQGGLSALRDVRLGQSRSELAAHRTTLEAHLQAHPPATIAQASALIEEMTGVKRGPTQVRRFLHSLGMKPRKVGQIPAKANVAAQEEFKTNELEPRLKAAESGASKVFFLDAAHFVYAPFLGVLWCVQRLFVQAPSGRQRLNVLGALDAITKVVLTVHNLTYITSATICEMLMLLVEVNPGIPLTLVLDNARYQRCALVQDLAGKLGIELLFLPPYSPNLNLIERLWKFVKKESLYGKYYANKEAFQRAILECLAETDGKHKEKLESLMSLKFQTFEQVPIVGEAGKVIQFPGAGERPPNVSSKAA